VSLVKTTVKSCSRGVQQNLFCNFWTFLQVSINFGSLKQILKFKIIKKRFKIAAQCRAESGPWLRPSGVAACGQGARWPVSFLAHGRGGAAFLGPACGRSGPAGSRWPAWRAPCALSPHTWPVWWHGRRTRHGKVRGASNTA
jgi:hypothetical protein